MIFCLRLFDIPLPEFHCQNTTEVDVITLKQIPRYWPLCGEFTGDGNSPVTGEFPAQRPVTRSFDVFFVHHLNKRLSKQWWGWWFETPLRPLWRHCNALVGFFYPRCVALTNHVALPRQKQVTQPFWPFFAWTSFIPDWVWIFFESRHSALQHSPRVVKINNTFSLIINSICDDGIGTGVGTVFDVILSTHRRLYIIIEYEKR